MEINVRQFSSDKILKHFDRVNAWLKGENPAPITVELDMTNLCNHRCPECSGWYFQNRNSDSLSFNLATDIIRQLAKAEVRGLIFTGGGEPLCHPNIKEVVQLAYNSGLDTGFITNGSLINEEIARILLDCCTWLRVSLDAASAETFERTHGMDGNAFKKVVDNIALLTKMKSKLKSKTTIGVGYLTCDYAKNEMYDMATLCKKLGVDYLQFRPLQIHNNGKFEYHRSDIKKEIFRCLKQSNTNYKVLYSKHKYDMMKEKNYGRNYHKCYGQQFATVIAADAHVYVCCHMRGYDKYCLGDLEKNTFEEIWDSLKRKKVIENIDFHDCVPLCRDNTFNQILWNIKQPREHVNFL
jgi:MoaA/NifB/PqqE/SkfB family radical SAM enzyme